MNKYQEALNRIKTAPSFMGGTDLYKTHLNSSERFLQDIATLQELVDKATPKKIKKPMSVEDMGYYSCPVCDGCHYNPLDDMSWRLSKANYCPECGQKLDWSDVNDEN